MRHVIEVPPPTNIGTATPQDLDAIAEVAAGSKFRFAVDSHLDPVLEWLDPYTIVSSEYNRDLHLKLLEAGRPLLLAMVSHIGAELVQLDIDCTPISPQHTQRNAFPHTDSYPNTPSGNSRSALTCNVLPPNFLVGRVPAASILGQKLKAGQLLGSAADTQLIEVALANGWLETFPAMTHTVYGYDRLGIHLGIRNTQTEPLPRAFARGKFFA